MFPQYLKSQRIPQPLRFPLIPDGNTWLALQVKAWQVYVEFEDLSRGRVFKLLHMK